MHTTRDAIIDCALTLAEETSWERVRLYDIAAHLGVPLTDVHAHFREKEELADAWFDRADRAMLEASTRSEVQALPSAERLHFLIMAWLDTLAPHHQATRQMIQGKLEPGHLHVQLPAVLRISRTVQWLREAAHRDASGLHRGIEETVLTSIFVTTFAGWLLDETHDSRRTRNRLARLLHGAGWMARWLPGYHHPPGTRALPGAVSSAGNEATRASESLV